MNHRFSLRISAPVECVLTEQDFSPCGEWLEYVPLDLRVKIGKTEPGCTLTVQNAGQCMVEEVRFPICARTDSTQYDSLLFATAWGDNLHEPALNIRRYWEGRNGQMDSYAYIKCLENEVRYLYPSIMVMQFVTLYNDASSFYLASYSTGDSSMFFQRKGDRPVRRGAVHLALSVS